jgi:catechol 2,3-dioxygenase-like lactoylglutathione lyase family enzyme
MQSQVEHANITVSNLDATAKWLCEVFGWHIRWKGDAIHGGTSIHVGEDRSYLAIYKPPETPVPGDDRSHFTRGRMNHIGVTVDDIDAVEQKVIKAGFTPQSHANYEPGRRFYFHDHDGIEFEVVSYSK